MPASGQRMLTEARSELALRLAQLSAPAEVIGLVNTTAYDLLELAREDRPVVAVIFPVIKFFGEHGGVGDLELASCYGMAVCDVAAQFALRRTQLDRMNVDLRRRHVREAEERKLLPPSDGLESPRGMIGPDGTEVLYGRIARPRRPTDGPDAHYLRDYYWKVERNGQPGVLSLPCLACGSRRAPDRCAPECPVPGGRCSADWWLPTPPGVLGPHWAALGLTHRTASAEISRKEGATGARYGALGGRPSVSKEIVSLLDTPAEALPAEQDRLTRRTRRKVERG